MQTTDVGGSYLRDGPRAECRKDVLVPHALIFTRRPRLPPYADIFQVSRAELLHARRRSAESPVGRGVSPVRNFSELFSSETPRLLWRQDAVFAKDDSPRQTTPTE